MKRRIVVEDDLGNLKSVLQEQGYEVLGMNALSQNPDAVIISGLDKNLMNVQNIETLAPIIDAHGMDANQVVAELERRMNL